MAAENLDIKVMFGDLQSDEKCEGTLEGAREFLKDHWENKEIDKVEAEEDEFDLDDHLEEIRTADFNELNAMLQGIGKYIERL